MKRKPKKDQLQEVIDRVKARDAEVEGKSAWVKHLWWNSSELIEAVDARFQVLEMALAEAEETIKDLQRAPECPVCFSQDRSVRGVYMRSGKLGYYEDECEDDWHE